MFNAALRPGTQPHWPFWPQSPAQKARDTNIYVSLPAGGYRDAVLADSPASYWRLGESSGVTAADGAGLNPLTYVGGPTLGVSGALAGDVNTAVTLTPTTQWLTSSYSPFVAGSSRTFEGWAYRISATGDQIIFGGDTAGVSPALQMMGGSTSIGWYSNTGSGPVTWAAGVSTGSWFHWALTFNDATKSAELFVNGVSQGAQTSGVTYGASTTLQLGTFASGSQPWNGSLDEVAVYNAILSPAQVLAHYNAAPVVPGPGERSAAVALSVTKTQFVTLTQGLETDTAVAFVLNKLVTLGVGTETDAAQVLSIIKQLVITTATETDLSVAVTFSQVFNEVLVQGLETDSAQALVLNKTLSVTRADESDTAQPLSATAHGWINAAEETDSAQGLRVRSQTSLTDPGVEADSAVALTFTQTHHHDLIPADETDVAPAQSFSGGSSGVPERIFERPLKFPQVETIP